MFDQLDDGSHEITLRNIHVPGCGQYPKTHGTLRWTREQGISFELHFDGIFGVSSSEYFVSRAPEASGVGKFGKSDLATPQWIAETDDGTRVQLFGVNQTPSKFHQRGSNGNSTGSKFDGTALYAIVEIPTNRLLAFPESSREDFRMFFSGHAGQCYSTQEEVHFEDREQVGHGTTRFETELRNHPRVCLLNSYGQIKCRPSGWLSFEQAPTEADCDMAAVAEQTFVSFLNGQKVAFHWADRKIDADLVRRSYYGWAASPQHERCDAVFQPLPFLSGIEPFTYGQEVLKKLPQLFETFCNYYADIDFAVALHPMWTAQHSVLQDRVALAALSLERIASYWRSYKKSPKNQRQITAARTIWDQKKSLTTLKKGLNLCVNEWLTSLVKPYSFGERVKATLSEVLLRFLGDSSVQFRSEEDKRVFLNVIRKKIENITQTPNSESLKNPYLDVGLSISPAEQEALEARNTALHGHVRGNPTLDQLDKDAETFDHLRMLITKFVLQLCGYDGPFVDYASRPTAGNFVVRSMSEVTVDSHKVSVVKSHDE